MQTVTGVRCECSDPGCKGQHARYCANRATDILYRVDMQDETGTAMCDVCADDAFNSGMFTTREDEDAN